MRIKGLVALLAWLGLSSITSSASPCGAFVSIREKRVPSLAVEQTLIVFDAEQELEHFVRQVVIRDPSPGFGFVVPVPEQPTVTKVKKSPFETLARQFPPSSGLSIRPGRGGGGLASAGAPAVTVLSKERVGSFTAFVLAATDSAALEHWLKDNQLVVPPETRTWLDHYVELGFYFAALRYEHDSAKVDKGVTSAETLRITFKTPLPFYPYYEPTHAKAAGAERDLVVWLVSARDYVPVSLASAGAAPAWKRPLLQHYSRNVTRAELETLLDPELTKLLPGPSRLQLQVFEDQKLSRAGFGDIVMVPDKPVPLGDLVLSRSHKLMASLDPAVVP